MSVLSWISGRKLILGVNHNFWGILMKICAQNVHVQIYWPECVGPSMTYLIKLSGCIPTNSPNIPSTLWLRPSRLFFSKPERKSSGLHQSVFEIFGFRPKIRDFFFVHLSTENQNKKVTESSKSSITKTLKIVLKQLVSS